VTAVVRGPSVRTAARRVVYAEQVWGTVVVLDLRDPDGSLPQAPQVDDAVAAAVRELHWVDEVFSPFRPDSEVSQMRRGELPPTRLDPAEPRQAALLQVVEQCEVGRRLTGGAFDPWRLPGGFDPSGLVKGWAAQRVADLLVDAGVRHVSVNAGGDVVTRGLAAPGAEWRIGVRHPEHVDSLAAVVGCRDSTVATSGFYERGEHVHDVARARCGQGARSATVVGPDGGLADALATALLVAGRAGSSWFEALTGWSAFVVDPAPASTTWSLGPAFAP
jgi:thiamine biosynthesis lipoprotein